MAKLNSVALSPYRIYSTPAIAPLMLGVNGSVGQAQQNLANQYNYSLQQMAVSPFAVNNEEYLRRIRKQYGYNDEGLYTALGVTGSVVGAGVGALFGSGLIKYNGLTTDTKNIFSKSFYKSSNFQSPFEWTDKFNSKRNATSSTFARNIASTVDYNKIIKSLDLDEYNKAVDIVNILKASGAAPDSEAMVTAVKNLDKAKASLNQTLSTLKDTAKQADAVVDTADTVADTTKLAKNFGTTFNTIDNINDIQDAVNKGAKLATKGTGLIPYVGMAFDLASVGMDTAGLVQAIQSDSTNAYMKAMNISLNATALVGDIVSVVGDVLQFIPVVGQAVGGVLDWIGTGVSALAGALNGALVGGTIGKSLSPSGAKVQELYMKNTYSSLINRPITQIASVVSMIGTPMLLQAGTRAKSSLINVPSSFLTTDAFGNYLRSASTMLTTRALTSLTTEIDKSLPFTSDDIDDTSFVNAFTLWGDVNDNLFGATRLKTNLLGLASGSSDAQQEAFNRAWGFGDNIYNSPTMAEVREASGLNLGNFGNSILDTLGEIFIDPENYSEVAETISDNNRAVTVSKALSNDIYRKAIDIIRGDTNNKLDNDVAKIIFEIEDNKLVLDDNNQPKLTEFGRGILSSPQYTESLFNSMAQTYFKSGEEGLIDFLANRKLSRKGSKSIIMESKNEYDSYKALSDYFIKSLNLDNIKYDNIKRVDKKLPKDTLLKDGTEIVKALMNRYNATSVDVLNKLQAELDVKLDYARLNKLYNTDSNIKDYMDTISLFGSNVNLLNNLPIGALNSVLPNVIQKAQYSHNFIKDSKRVDRVININDAINNRLDTEVKKLTANVPKYLTDETTKPGIELTFNDDDISSEQKFVNQYLKLLDKKKKDLDKYERYAVRYSGKSGEPITVDSSNYNDYVQRVQLLEQKVAEKTATKNEKTELTDLKCAVNDYKLFTSNKKVYAKNIELLRNMIYSLSQYGIKAQQKLVNILSKYISVNKWITDYTISNNKDKWTAIIRAQQDVDPNFIANEFNKLNITLTDENVDTVIPTIKNARDLIILREYYERYPKIAEALDKAIDSNKTLQSSTRITKFNEEQFNELKNRLGNTTLNFLQELKNTGAIENITDLEGNTLSIDDIRGIGKITERPKANSISITVKTSVESAIVDALNTIIKSNSSVNLPPLITKLDGIPEVLTLNDLKDYTEPQLRNFIAGLVKLNNNGLYPEQVDNLLKLIVANPIELKNLINSIRSRKSVEYITLDQLDENQIRSIAYRSIRKDEEYQATVKQIYETIKNVEESYNAFVNNTIYSGKQKEEAIKEVKDDLAYIIKQTLEPIKGLSIYKYITAGITYNKEAEAEYNFFKIDTSESLLTGLKRSNKDNVLDNMLEFINNPFVKKLIKDSKAHDVVMSAESNNQSTTDKQYIEEEASGNNEIASVNVEEELIEPTVSEQEVPSVNAFRQNLAERREVDKERINSKKQEINLKNNIDDGITSTAKKALQNDKPVNVTTYIHKTSRYLDCLAQVFEGNSNIKISSVGSGYFVELKQSTYLKDSKLIPYADYLKLDRRNKNIYRDNIYTMFRNLIAKQDPQYITYYYKKGNKLIRIANNKALIGTLVNNYIKGNSIVINQDTQYGKVMVANTNISKLYRQEVYREFAIMLANHKFTDSKVKDLIKSLDKSNNKTAIYKSIYDILAKTDKDLLKDVHKKALENMTSIYNGCNIAHVRKAYEPLKQFELNTSKINRPEVAVVAHDAIYSSALLANDSLEDILYDVINLKNIQDTTKFKSTFGALLSLANDYITEDIEDGSASTSLKDMSINKDKKGSFVITLNDKDYSLEQFVFNYRVSLQRFIRLAISKYNASSDARVAADDIGRLVQEYKIILDDYINHNVKGVIKSKQLFRDNIKRDKNNTLTDEEIDKMYDEVNNDYNFKYFISTRTTTSKNLKSGTNEYIKAMYNPIVIKTYLNNKEDITKFFIELVHEYRKATDDNKSDIEKVLKNILLNDCKLSYSLYTNEHIYNTSKRLETELQEKAKTNEEKKLLRLLIQNLEKQKNNIQSNYSNIKDPIAHILNNSNDEELNRIFNSRSEYSDPAKYAMAVDDNGNYYTILKPETRDNVVHDVPDYATSIVRDIFKFKKQNIDYKANNNINSITTKANLEKLFDSYGIKKDKYTITNTDTTSDGKPIALVVLEDDIDKIDIIRDNTNILVYTITKKQYADIVSSYKNGNYDLTIGTIYKLTDTDKKLDTIINIKGSTALARSIKWDYDSYINKYELTDKTSLEDLDKIRQDNLRKNDIVNKYTMFDQTFNTRNNLIETDLYKKFMVTHATVTLAAKKYLDMFITKDEDQHLVYKYKPEYVLKFFSNHYIENPDEVLSQVKDNKIANEIVKALQYVKQNYYNKDIKYTTDRILNEKFVTKLEQLNNIISKPINDTSSIWYYASKESLDKLNHYLTNLTTAERAVRVRQNKENIFQNGLRILGVAKKKDYYLNLNNADDIETIYKNAHDQKLQDFYRTISHTKAAQEQYIKGKKALSANTYKVNNKLLNTIVKICEAIDEGKDSGKNIDKLFELLNITEYDLNEYMKMAPNVYEVDDSLTLAKTNMYNDLIKPFIKDMSIRTLDYKGYYEDFFITQFWEDILQRDDELLTKSEKFISAVSKHLHSYRNVNINRLNKHYYYEYNTDDYIQNVYMYLHDYLVKNAGGASKAVFTKLVDQFSKDEKTAERLAMAVLKDEFVERDPATGKKYGSIKSTITLEDHVKSIYNVTNTDFDNILSGLINKLEESVIFNLKIFNESTSQKQAVIDKALELRNKDGKDNHANFIYFLYKASYNDKVLDDVNYNNILNKYGISKADYIETAYKLVRDIYYKNGHKPLSDVFDYVSIYKELQVILEDNLKITNKNLIPQEIKALYDSLINESIECYMNSYTTIYYYINKGEKDTPVSYTKKDLVNSIKGDLLNKDEDFFKTLKTIAIELNKKDNRFSEYTYLFNRNGITKEQLDNCNNVDDIYRIIITTGRYDVKNINSTQRARLITLLMFIENCKYVYINNNIKDNNPDTYYRTLAHEYIEKPILESKHTIEDLDRTSLFGGSLQSTAITKYKTMSKPIDTVISSLALVKAKNEDLVRNVDYTSSLKAQDRFNMYNDDETMKYVVLQRNNMTTLAKNVQSHLYGNMFNNKFTGNDYTKTLEMYRSSLNNFSNDLYIENNSDTLEMCGSSGYTTAQDIRKLFTTLIKVVDDKQDFVRMVELCTLLADMNNKTNGIMARNVYIYDDIIADLKKGMTKKQKEEFDTNLENAKHQIISYFNERNYLVNMDTKMVDALIAGILTTRSNQYSTSKDKALKKLSNDAILYRTFIDRKNGSKQNQMIEVIKDNSNTNKLDSILNIITDNDASIIKYIKENRKDIIHDLDIVIDKYKSYNNFTFDDFNNIYDTLLYAQCKQTKDLVSIIDNDLKIKDYNNALAKTKAKIHTAEKELNKLVGIGEDSNEDSINRMNYSLNEGYSQRYNEQLFNQATTDDYVRLESYLDDLIKETNEELNKQKEDYKFDYKFSKYYLTKNKLNIALTLLQKAGANKYIDKINEKVKAKVESNIKKIKSYLSYVVQRYGYNDEDSFNTVIDIINEYNVLYNKYKGKENLDQRLSELKEYLDDTGHLTKASISKQLNAKIKEALKGKTRATGFKYKNIVDEDLKILSTVKYYESKLSLLKTIDNNKIDYNDDDVVYNLMQDFDYNEKLHKFTVNKESETSSQTIMALLVYNEIIKDIKSERKKASKSTDGTFNMSKINNTLIINSISNRSKRTLTNTLDNMSYYNAMLSLLNMFKLNNTKLESISTVKGITFKAVGLEHRAKLTDYQNKVIDGVETIIKKDLYTDTEINPELYRFGKRQTADEYFTHLIKDFDDFNLMKNTLYRYINKGVLIIDDNGITLNKDKVDDIYTLANYVYAMKVKTGDTYSFLDKDNFELNDSNMDILVRMIKSTFNSLYTFIKDKTNPQLLKTNLKDYEDDTKVLTDNQDIIKKTQSNKDKKQYDDFLIDIIKGYLTEDTNELTEQDIDELTHRFETTMIENTMISKDETYKTKKELLEKYKKQKDRIKRYRKLQKDIPGYKKGKERLENAIKERSTELTEKINIQQDNFAKHINTNINLLKSNLKVDVTTPNDEALDLAFKFARENNIINKNITQHAELHDSIADTLVTAINYLYQKDMVDDNGKIKVDMIDENGFKVLDIETLPYNGEQVPYQITIQHIYKQDGKIVLRTINSYFNSPVIYEPLNDDGTYGVAMQEFYDQYNTMFLKSDKAISMRDSGASDAEIDAECKVSFEKVLSRIANSKNTMTNIGVIVDELAATKGTIVAHNGNTFDIPITAKMIRSYANRLLNNIYYNIYKDVTLELVDKNVNPYTLSEDELDSKMLDIKSKIDKLVKQEVLSNQDTQRIRRLAIQLMHEYERLVFVKQYKKDFLNQVGVIINKNETESMFTDANSTYNKVLNILQKHMESNNKQQCVEEIYAELKANMRDNEITNASLKVLKDRVSALYDSIQDRYIKVFKGDEDVFTQSAINDYLSKIFDEKKQIGLETPAERIRYTQELIKQYEDILEYRETNKEVDDAITDINKEIDDINNKITAITNEITNKEAEIRDTKSHYNKVLTLLDKYQKELTEVSNSMLTKLNIAVNNEYGIRLRNNNLEDLDILMTLNTIKYEYQRSMADIIDKLTKLSRIINIINKTDTQDISTLTTAQQDKYHSLKSDNDKYEYLLETSIENYLTKELVLFDIDKIKTREDKVKFIDELNTRLNKINEDLDKVKDYQNGKLGSTEQAAIIKSFGDNIKQTLIKNLNLISKLNPDIFKEYTDKDSLNEIITDYAKQKQDFKAYIVDKLEDEQVVNINKIIIDEIEPMVKLADRLEQLKSKSLDEKFDNLYQAIESNLLEQSSSIQNTMDVLSQYDVNSERIVVSDVTKEGITKIVTTLIDKIGTTDKQIKTINNKLLEGVLIKSPNSSLDGDEEVFNREASVYDDSTTDPEVLMAKELGAVRVLKDLTKNNDQYVGVLKSNKLYCNSVNISKDNPEYGTQAFYVSDAEHLVMQKVIINVKKNDKGIWEFLDIKSISLNYCYNFIGEELNNPKSSKLEFFTTKKANALDKFSTYMTNTYDFYNKVLFMSGNNVARNENGVDLGYESIKALYDFLVQFKDGNKEEFKKASISSNLDIVKDLQYINVTKEAKKKFLLYSNVLNNLKANGGYSNTANIYKSITSKVLSKYKSLNPSNILLCIPEEFASDAQIITPNTNYDDINIKANDGKELTIAKVKASEGSMGKVYGIKTRYSSTPLGAANTNPIRLVLISKLIEAKWTPIGIINRIFEYANRQDNKFNLTEELTKMLNDKGYTKKYAKQLADEYNIPDADKASWIDNQIKFIEERNTWIKDNLVDKFNGNLFTPSFNNIEEAEMFEKGQRMYTGFNITVTFADDPRAYEDGILIDADLCKYLGYTAASKSWLGAGYKGAIIPVEGLYKQYGSYAVASLASVIKRGTYIMYEELMMNKIRDFILSAKDLDNEINNIDKSFGADKFFETDSFTPEQYEKTKAFIRNIKTYDDIDTFKKSKQPFGIVNKQLLVNQDVVYDFQKYFRYVLGYDYTKLITKKKHVEISAKDVYRVQDYYKRYNKETHRVDVADKVKIDDRDVILDGDVIQGTLYMRMDNENYAVHKQTMPNVYGDDDITYTEKDITGSIEKGGMFSFALEQITGQKTPTLKSWQKYLIDDTTTSDILDKTLRIKTYGFENYNELIDNYYKNHKEKISASDFIKTLDAKNQMPETFIEDYFNTYYETYYRLTHGEQNEDECNFILNLYNNKAKDEAFSRLTTERGLGNRAEYQRHLAVRTQLTPKTSFELGELKVPRNQVLNLLKQKNIAKTINSYKYNIDNLLKGLDLDTIQGTLDAIKLLEYNGIYEKTYIKVNGKYVEHTNYKFTSTPVIKKVNGIDTVVYAKGIEFEPDIYKSEISVFAIRVPVQDYNAVPICRITGANDHAGTECFTYLYKMIGGDNDGDTAAFIPVDYNAVSKGELKTLDASRPEYYEGGYFENCYDGYIELDKSTNTLTNKVVNGYENYKASDMTYAFFGKMASPNYKPTPDAKAKKVRSHYEWYELYNLAYASKKADLIKLANTKYPNLELQTLDDKRLWVAIYILENTEGNSETKDFSKKDYSNPEKIESYYKAHKQDIDDMYKINKYINDAITLKESDGSVEYKYVNENELKSLIKVLLGKYNSNDDLTDIEKHIVNCVTNQTLKRGRSSKLGINQVGGQRKDINLGTYTSVFNKLNEDPSGQIWEDCYGVKYNEVSINNIFKNYQKELSSIIAQLIKDTKNNVNDDDKRNKVYQWIKSLKDSRFNGNNVNESQIIDWIADCLISTSYVNNDLAILNKILHDDITYRELVDITKSASFVKDNTHGLLYKYYANLIDENGKVIDIIADKKVPKAEKQLFNIAVFGRSYNRAENKLAKYKFNENDQDYKDLVKYYTDEILDGMVLTRPLSKQLSDLAQDPISLSKHGVVIISPSAKYDQFGSSVDDFKNKYVKLTATFGNAVQQRRYTALGLSKVDLDTDDSFEIGSKYYDYNMKGHEVNEDLEQLRKDYYKLYNITTNFINRDITPATVTDAVRYEMKRILFSADYLSFNGVEAPMYDIVFNQIQIIGSIIAKVNNFVNISKSDAKTLKEAVKVLQSYDIRFSSIIKAIQGAGSIIRKANIINMSRNKNAAYITAKDLLNTKNKFAVLDNADAFINLAFGKIYSDRDGFRKEMDAITDTDTKIFTDYITKGNVDINLLLDDGSLRTIDANYIENNKYDNKYNRLVKNEETRKGTVEEQDSIFMNFYLDDVFNKSINNIKLDDSTNLYNVLKEILAGLEPNIENINTLDVYKPNNKSNKALSILHQVIGENLYDSNKINTQNIKQVWSKINKLDSDLDDLTFRKNQYENELRKYNKRIEELTDKKKLFTSKEAIKNEINRLKEDLDTQYKYLFGSILMQEIGSLKLLLNKDRPLIYNNSNEGKPLTNDDIKQFKESKVMNLCDRVKSITTVISLFKINEQDNSVNNINWDKFYQFYKRNYPNYKLVMVADDNDAVNQGLLKHINDYFYNKDETAKKNTFGSVEEFTDFVNEHMDKSIELKFNGKTYTSIAQDLDIKALESFVAPRLVEVEVNSPEVFKRIYESNTNAKSEQDVVPIGFISRDELNAEIEDFSRPYKQDGKLARVISSLNSKTKTAMRFSVGFLFRNFFDTCFQLSTDLYSKLGMGAILNAKQVWKISSHSLQIYELYKELSAERTLTLADIDMNFMTAKKILEKNIDNPTTLDNAINNIKTYLDKYITSLTESNSRTTRANDLKTRLNELLNNKEKFGKDYNVYLLNTLESIDQLLVSISFAEYSNSYNTMKVMENAKISKLYNKIINDSNAKSMLFQVSAFMNTTAETDYLKQGEYKVLMQLMNDYSENDGAIPVDRIKSLEELQADLDKAKKELGKDLEDNIRNPISRYYSKVNTWIENAARITSFLYHRAFYDETFNQSTAESLRQWFNYGLRSPLEMNLMYDIPYISFPIRSISNWIDRILDPKMAKLMDDIIDGMYGQYKDDNGQYDSWTKFMISNGWLPLTKNFGIRMGNGMFDVMSMLNNPSEYMQQRSNPLVKALISVVENKNIMNAIGQIPQVNMMVRGINLLSPTKSFKLNSEGELEIKQKTIGNSLSIFFDYNNYNTDDVYTIGSYNKYTPNKYRNYNYNQNNRYRYENIYKNLFNKFGNRRKEARDYNLVKQIQWNRFVRTMQSRYIMSKIK